MRLRNDLRLGACLALLLQHLEGEMSETWFLLNSGAQLPPLNMATDELLLDLVAEFGRPVLRFYGWTKPAATFGYFQRFQEVAKWTALRPLIRRPTGGGLVPHDTDWTYSIVFPPEHAWYQLRAQESYRAAHAWVSSAFTELGLSTQLALTPLKRAAGQCFLGAETFDVVRNGVKLAGAAQRRTRAGLLIQGSIQPQGCSFDRKDWERAMLGTASFPGAVSWVSLALDKSLVQRAFELAESKYRQASYNERR